MDKKPVYCMYCSNWYALTKADQCDVPVHSEISFLSQNVAGFETPNVVKSIFGQPSKLNKNNNCCYYNKASFFIKLARRIFLDIPLKPSLETIAKE